MARELLTVVRKAFVILAAVLVLPIVLLAIPVGLISGIFTAERSQRLRRAFLKKWAPRRTLLVYSNSPHWRDYIEANWLPRLKDHAVVLNWSERSTWKKSAPLEAAIFRRYLGTREFNPAAVVLHRVAKYTPWQALKAGRYFDALFLIRRDTTTVRFWQAFRDLRHGKPGPLKEREAELFALVAHEARGDA